MRYYLEVVEDGRRLPVGAGLGYPTLEQAKQFATKWCDDALPQNTVMILAHVATAGTGGDGDAYVREET